MVALLLEQKGSGTSSAGWKQMQRRGPLDSLSTELAVPFLGTSRGINAEGGCNASTWSTSGLSGLKRD